MVTSAERGREVRQRLLRAAGELIAERGWTAVTTRLLAERAGVAPGLVHYHFPSVQALLVESAAGSARSLGASLDAALAGARSADEALRLLLGSLDAHDGADPTSVLLLEAYLAAARDEPLRDALGAVISDVRSRLSGVLAEHAVPDPDATAAVLVAALDGVLLHRALAPEPGGAATVLRRLLSVEGTEPPR